MTTQTHHVCPWWMGYLLNIPLRKCYHNTETILKPYLQTGMKAVDYGCAMGYFTLPMARLVGESGKVFAFDIQEKMISSLTNRAEKAHLGEIINPVLIDDHLEKTKFTNIADFALLFAMVHEVPDKMQLFKDIANMVKSNGQVVFAEPRGHVSDADFNISVGLAELAGFKKTRDLKIPGSLAVELTRG